MSEGLTCRQQIRFGGHRTGVLHAGMNKPSETVLKEAVDRALGRVEAENLAIVEAGRAAVADSKKVLADVAAKIPTTSP
jgi:hypothetical protein